MPRGARLDAPGSLHHVMVRGIEGNRIVIDDEDRHEFVSRMGKLAHETGTKIYAWSLMTNHAHVLLKSGAFGLTFFMKKLLTGYAIWFNRRHQRHGYLFQNRYKSIICEEEVYFLKLVSYIHLNPFRAGLVNSIDEMNSYPWCGHAVIINQIENIWQDRDAVLQCFSHKESEAQQAYQEYLIEQSGLGTQPHLTGGGLVRSAGGWSEVFSLKQRGEKQFSDQRILGRGAFVKEILDEAEENIKTRVPVSRSNDNALELLENRCEEAGILSQELKEGSKRRVITAVRKELAVKFIKEMGMSYADAAKLLGISASAVNQIFRRGDRQGKVK